MRCGGGPESPLRAVRRRPDQGQPPGLARGRGRPGRTTRSPRRSRRRGPTPRPGRSSRSRSTRSSSSTSRLRCGPDIILVDNLGPEGVAEAVRRRDAVGPAVRLEASGGDHPGDRRGAGGHGGRPDQRRRADPFGPGAGPGAGLRDRGGRPVGARTVGRVTASRSDRPPSLNIGSEAAPRGGGGVRPDRRTARGLRAARGRRGSRPIGPRARRPGA